MADVQAESSPATPETVAVAENTETPQAASTPAEPSSAEPASESAPVSETGKPKRSDAESRIKELHAKVKALERQLQPLPVKAEAPPAEPQAAQFSDYEVFEKEKLAWHVQKAIREDREARELERQKLEAQEQNAKLEKSWNERLKDTRKRVPNFDVKAALQAVQPNATTDAFLLDSDIGPDLTFHLSTHPEDAERIRDLAPFQTVRELIRLEANLRNQIKGITPKDLPDPPHLVRGSAAPRERKTIAQILYGKG